MVIVPLVPRPEPFPQYRWLPVVTGCAVPGPQRTPVYLGGEYRLGRFAAIRAFRRDCVTAPGALPDSFASCVVYMKPVFALRYLPRCQCLPKLIVDAEVPLLAVGFYLRSPFFCFCLKRDAGKV